jgi:hypothetical protein
MVACCGSFQSLSRQSLQQRVSNCRSLFCVSGCLTPDSLSSHRDQRRLKGPPSPAINHFPNVSPIVSLHSRSPSLSPPLPQFSSTAGTATPLTAPPIHRPPLTPPPPQLTATALMESFGRRCFARPQPRRLSHPLFLALPPLLPYRSPPPNFPAQILRVLSVPPHAPACQVHC